MLCLSGFELYSRWVPLSKVREKSSVINSEGGILKVVFRVLFHPDTVFIEIIQS